MVDSVGSSMVDLLHILWPQGNKIKDCWWNSIDRTDCPPEVLSRGPLEDILLNILCVPQCKRVSVSNSEPGLGLMDF